MSFTIVTAFVYISRESWQTSSRETEHYFQCFEEFFFQPYKMVVFIDDRYANKVYELKEKYNDTKMKVIPINEEWMKKNIWCWNLLDKESEIMNSQSYFNLVKNRYTDPEVRYPKYTLVNHAKIDFVCNAIDNNLVEDELVAWADFGCRKNTDSSTYKPFNKFNFNLIDVNKLNACIMKDIVESDKDIIHQMVHQNPTITGGFFMGNKAVLKKYQELYHITLLTFQFYNLADDDQHILLRCYLQCPELFKLRHTNNEWNLCYTFFEEEPK